MTRLKSKLIASSLAVALLIAGVTPTVAHAEEVTGSGGDLATAQQIQVPSTFTVTSDMLGGNLTVDIPDSISITPSVDGEGKLNADLTANFSVSAKGALYPTRVLKIAIPKSISFYNSLNTNLAPVNGAVAVTGIPTGVCPNLSSTDGVLSIADTLSLFEYDGDSSSWVEGSKPSGINVSVLNYPASTLLPSIVFNASQMSVTVDDADIKYTGDYSATVDFYITVADSITS